ncbi:hypothetical protein DENSPDRAFT_883447 [Dentipellis sp. KUC8613]|nr:hypothetical protein DENSPDRAFT_883447 [Dentipellis sp. KUC8613]
MAPTVSNVCFAPYPAVYELDSEGNRIPDPVLGWKLTPQSMENRRKWREERFRGAEPLEELTPFQKYYPQVPWHTPPKMFFGLAVQWHHFVDYAKRHGIELKEPDSTEHDRICYAVMVSTEHMSKLVRAPLGYETPRVEGADMMIALWSNYNWLTQELEDEERDEVISILQKELGITAKPMWYYDSRTT